MKKKIQAIKRLIAILEIAHHSDHLTYNALINSDLIENEIKSAKNEIGWTEDDSRIITDLMQLVEKETVGKKTIKERYLTTSNVLKVGFGILTGAVIGTAGAIGVKKLIGKNNGTEKK